LREANSTREAVGVVVFVLHVVLEGAGETVVGEALAELHDGDEESAPGEFVGDFGEGREVLRCWHIYVE